MPSFNPFASYQVEMPEEYQDLVKKYSRSGGRAESIEFSPFDRQVDVWFAAFLIAVNEGLEPVVASKTYKVTPASILSTDPDRIAYMQLAAVGITGGVEVLRESKRVFDLCSGLANAGLPKLFQILSDEDDRPLWSVLESFETMSREG